MVPVALPAAAQGDRVADDLARYIRFGRKASGGRGDDAAGVWMEAELRAAGYAVSRQRFDVPCFDTATATLATAANSAAVLPQAIVVPTGVRGVRGRLVRAVPGQPAAVGDAIALVDLPSGRWSSALAKPIRATVASAFAAGARAAVVVTNGPSGLAVALNAPGDTALFPGPVASLAPRDAAPFLAAATSGDVGTLTVVGEGGRRPAFNLIGRLDRGRGRWLIVTTPRSGWFTCAGERGGGVAAWLGLARWAVAALPEHDLAFVCTSGHEYEYLGAEVMMRSGALPRPDRTPLWLHLGANVAARDWHELTGTPLPSADAQRYLMASAPLLDRARRAFVGQPGLESPLAAGGAAAGELAGILDAGYAAAGIFGAHRFHHTADDDVCCVAPALVAAALDGCRRFVTASLA